MERLTERNKHGVAVMRLDVPTGMQGGLVATLAAYEDTGLTPEEVVALKNERGGWEFDRTCPTCGEDIDVAWANCPYCGQHVPPKEEDDAL